MQCLNCPLTNREVEFSCKDLKNKKNEVDISTTSHLEIGTQTFCFLFNRYQLKLHSCFDFSNSALLNHEFVKFNAPALLTVNGICNFIN